MNLPDELIKLKDCYEKEKMAEKFAKAWAC
jgi:hypothetical protein